MSFNQIPNDYFKNLKAKIFEQVENLQDDLINEAPLLSKIKRTEIYTVPDNYFENLPNRILSHNQKPVRNINWFMISGVAASLLLCIALFTLKNDATTTDFSEEELYAYYEEDVLFELGNETEILDESLIINDYFNNIDEEEFVVFFDEIYTELSEDDWATIESGLEDL